MTYAPLARIIVRYGVGLTVGHEVADATLADGDVMLLLTDMVAWVAIGVGAAVEIVYAQAKKRGWST